MPYLPLHFFAGGLLVTGLLALPAMAASGVDTGPRTLSVAPAIATYVDSTGERHSVKSNSVTLILPENTVKPDKRVTPPRPKTNP